MRWIASILLVALAAVVLSTFQSTTPRYAALTGPIVTSGKQGEVVASKTFSVDVLKVLRAYTITFKGIGRPVERQTQGIWVIVTARAEALQETMPLRIAAIRGTSGRLYQQTRRADVADGRISDFDLQPGLPAKGIFVFEMPEEETKDMVLVLSSQLGPQLESEIHIKLDQQGINTIERTDLAGHG